MAATSGEKSSAVCSTLMPMPSTRYWSRPVSASTDSSVRIPQSFLPPSTGSLGHFSPGRTPHTCSTARHTATPASAVTGISRSVGRSGRSKTVR